MRRQINITRNQFCVLIAGVLPLALVVTLIPEDVVGDLIGGCFYVPFVFAHSIIQISGDRTTLLWAYYALHIWAGVAMLASALKWLRFRPVSRWLIVFHTIGVLLVSAYYAVIIASFFGPAAIMLWLHPFQNSRFDPALWTVIGSIFTLSVLGPSRITPHYPTPSLKDSPDNPMQVAWFRRLRSLALFLAAKRVHRPLLVAALAIVACAGVRVWRVTLGRRLVETAADGSVSQANLLLRLGADPNVTAYHECDVEPDGGGYQVSALEQAVDRASLPMVRALVVSGSKLKSNNSSLINSIAAGNVEMVRLLLDSCDGPLDSGLLYYGVRHLRIYDLLRAHGADPDVVYGRGNTALGLAASVGNFKAVDYLLARGAHLNVRDRDGWTPVLHAAYVDRRDMVKYLLRHGANSSMDCHGSDTSDLSMDQAKATVRSVLADVIEPHVKK